MLLRVYRLLLSNQCEFRNDFSSFFRRTIFRIPRADVNAENSYLKVYIDRIFFFNYEQLEYGIWNIAVKEGNFQNLT